MKWITGGPAFARSFRLFEQLGFDTAIVYAHHKNGETREITISHADYDGINGFTAMLLQSNALLPDSFPAVPPRKKGLILWVLLKRFLQYFRVLWQFSRKSREWKDSPRCVSKIFSVWRFLSVEETRRLRELSRREGTSLNSYLLHRLNAVVLPKLQPSELPATWIVPVSLYTEYESAKAKGIKTSIMEVSLDESDTPGTVHAKVKKEVDTESYWGSIVAVLINEILPDSAIRKILAATVASKKRVGTFSNIGKWKGVEHSADETWSVVPPVHPGQPVGIGAIEFNGKLGLGLKVDPSIGLDEKMARELLDAVLAVKEEAYV